MFSSRNYSFILLAHLLGGTTPCPFCQSSTTNRQSRNGNRYTLCSLYLTISRRNQEKLWQANTRRSGHPLVIFADRTKRKTSAFRPCLVVRFYDPEQVWRQGRKNVRGRKAGGILGLPTDSVLILSLAEDVELFAKLVTRGLPGLILFLSGTNLGHQCI